MGAGLGLNRKPPRELSPSMDGFETGFYEITGFAAGGPISASGSHVGGCLKFPIDVRASDASENISCGNAVSLAEILRSSLLSRKTRQTRHFERKCLIILAKSMSGFLK